MAAAVCDFLLKFVVVGDCNVGKTTLLKRCVVDTEGQRVDFKVKSVRYDGLVYKMQLWDTTHRRSTRALETAEYRNANGILAVFNLSDRSSFENMAVWLKRARDHGVDNVVIVGNKADQLKTRVVTQEEANKFADSHQCSYVETSARTGAGVEDVVLCLVKGFRARLRAPILPERDVPDNANRCF